MFEAYCREKLGPLALRLALGLVCVCHGYLKIMASGGTAWANGLPLLWQVLIAWAEFTGGVAILLGFRCRVAAAGVLAVTVGQVAWWHGWQLFNLPLRTLEPTVVVLLMGLSLLFLGAGQLALDARGGGRGGAARAGKKR
jgi:putative oxidoreductase